MSGAERLHFHLLLPTKTYQCVDDCVMVPLAASSLGLKLGFCLLDELNLMITDVI